MKTQRWSWVHIKCFWAQVCQNEFEYCNESLGSTKLWAAWAESGDGSLGIRTGLEIGGVKPGADRWNHIRPPPFTVDLSSNSVAWEKKGFTLLRKCDKSITPTFVTFSSVLFADIAGGTDCSAGWVRPRASSTTSRWETPPSLCSSATSSSGPSAPAPRASSGERCSAFISASVSPAKGAVHIHSSAKSEKHGSCCMGVNNKSLGI